LHGLMLSINADLDTPTKTWYQLMPAAKELCLNGLSPCGTC
jgi:hypothetical protein